MKTGRLECGKREHSREKVGEMIEHLLEQGRTAIATDPMRTQKFLQSALKMAQVHGELEYVAICCERLGTFNRIVEDYPESLRYLITAQSLFEDLPDQPIAKIVVAYGLGVANAELGNLRVALDHYLDSLSHCTRAMVVEWKGRVMSAIADLHRRRGEYHLAIDMLSSSLAESARIGDVREMISRHNDLAVVHCERGAWDDAIASYSAGLKLAQRERFPQEETLALMNIGICYIVEEDTDEALRYLWEALSRARSLGLARYEIEILMNISTVYMQKEDFETALQYDLLALGTLEDHELEEQRPVVLQGIGRVYLHMGKPDHALHYASEGLNIAEALGPSHVQCGLCRLMADIQEHLERWDSALEYYKRHLQLLELLAKTERGRGGFVVQDQGEMKVPTQEREERRSRLMRLEQEAARKAKELTAAALKLTRKEEGFRRLQEYVESWARSGQGDVSRTLTELLQRAQNAGGDDDLMTFQLWLQELQPEFLHTLSNHCPTLTPMELKVCGFLRLRMSSKDIAALMNISPTTVDTHRRNIRMKLELPTGMNLKTFLATL